MNISERKKSFRLSLKEVWKLCELKEISTQICTHLKQSEIWKKSKNILMYMPFNSEVNIKPLFEEREKNFYLPIVNPMSFVKYEKPSLQIHNSPDQTSQILEWEILDLILVPGLGFDENKNRIGRGLGFYDKLLQTVHQKKPEAISIGISPEAILNYCAENSIPTESGLDQKVQLICSERGIR